MYRHCQGERPGRGLWHPSVSTNRLVYYAQRELVVESFCTINHRSIFQVMNCVRRSNALLGYSKELQYGDCAVKVQSWSAWIKGVIMATTMGAAVYAPSLLGGVLPKPGQGPPRKDMENGFLKLHAVATMVETGGGGVANNNNNIRKLEGLFQFNKDTAYLYTAALLCETGMLLVEKHGALEGGCKTPAAALGGDLTQRILKEMDTSLEINEVER